MTANTSEAVVDEIVEKARIANKKLDISGILLVVDNCFMQYIEGPEESIKELYYRHIAHDRRHQRVKVLLEGPTDHRKFESWEMGKKILDKNDTKEATLCNLKDKLEANPDLAIAVLEYFYKTGEIELTDFWNQ